MQITSKSAVSASNDSDGNPTQWKYEGQVLQPSSSKYGYEGWIPAVFTDENGDAVTNIVDIFNFREINNDGTGIQGNGINHDGTAYPTNVKMIDLLVDEIYPALKVTKTKIDKSGEEERIYEYWVNSPNGEDGTCN